MQRREFLARLAIVAALPLACRSEDAFTAALERGAAPDTAGFEPPLDAAEQRFLDALAEGILPATDTPGARAAGVPEFISVLFAEWMTREEQRAFRDGLRALAEDCVARHGRAFAGCAPAEQLALLEAWDRAAHEASHGHEPPFFRRLKSLVVIGYYTSEVGQTAELRVRFGAGESEPCGPVLQPPPFRM